MTSLARIFWLFLAALASVAANGQQSAQIDPVAVSPDPFTVLLDNAQVRVVEYTLRPGERDHMQTSAIDQGQVVDAMRTMYVAATQDDLALFHSVTAPGFYAYDLGKRFTGDELMALIRSRHAAGVVYVWRVTEPEVHIDGITAWITYVNRGSITDVSGTKDVTWLESAVLRKEKDNWRIQFFHSTRVP